MSAGVELRVQGARFTGWTSVEVAVSIETACRSFSFEAIRQSDEPTAPIPQDADCEIWLEGQKVITGVIGRVQSTRSRDRNRISVSGRSKTRELVDCTAQVDSGGRWNGATMAKIATELAEEYGVEVVDLAGDTTPFGSFALKDDDETVYQTIERAARVRSLLLTDDAEGRLVLTRAGLTKAGTIERGQNILSSDVSGDSEQLYSEIRCKGSRVGNDGDFGAALFAEASAEDDGPRRYRLLVVKPEGRADAAACEARAHWEIATRYGKSIALKYEVPGWTRPDGQLWTPNVQTRVIDPTEYVNGTFLLVSVSYILSESEFRTQLELAPIEAYQPLVLPKLVRRGKKKAKLGFDITEPETIGSTVRQNIDVRGKSGKAN